MSERNTTEVPNAEGIVELINSADAALSEYGRGVPSEKVNLYRAVVSAMNTAWGAAENNSEISAKLEQIIEKSANEYLGNGRGSVNAGRQYYSWNSSLSTVVVLDKDDKRKHGDVMDGRVDRARQAMTVLRDAVKLD